MLIILLSPAEPIEKGGEGFNECIIARSAVAVFYNIVVAPLGIKVKSISTRKLYTSYFEYIFSKLPQF